MRKMLVIISKMQLNNEDWFTGTVHIPGLAPTKLIRRSTFSPRYNTRHALEAAALSMGVFLGLQVQLRDEKPGQKEGPA